MRSCIAWHVTLIRDSLSTTVDPSYIHPADINIYTYLLKLKPFIYIYSYLVQNKERYYIIRFIAYIFWRIENDDVLTICRQVLISRPFKYITDIVYYNIIRKSIMFNSSQNIWWFYETKYPLKKKKIPLILI